MPLGPMRACRGAAIASAVIYRVFSHAAAVFWTSSMHVSSMLRHLIPVRSDSSQEQQLSAGFNNGCLLHIYNMHRSMQPCNMHGSISSTFSCLMQTRTPQCHHRLAYTIESCISANILRLIGLAYNSGAAWTPSGRPARWTNRRWSVSLTTGRAVTSNHTAVPWIRRCQRP
jgi:hypothetical protein